jgi:hypothetical protein
VEWPESGSQTECGPRTERYFFRSQGIRGDDLEDLVSYIKAIPLRPNRYRAPDGELTPAQERGKAIFLRTNRKDGTPIPEGLAVFRLPFRQILHQSARRRCRHRQANRSLAADRYAGADQRSQQRAVSPRWLGTHVRRDLDHLQSQGPARRHQRSRQG